MALLFSLRSCVETCHSSSPTSTIPVEDRVVRFVDHPVVAVASQLVLTQTFSGYASTKESIHVAISPSAIRQISSESASLAEVALALMTAVPEPGRRVGEMILLKR